MKQLSRHAAGWLSEFSAAELRFQQGATEVPMLEAQGDSTFAAHQQIAQQAKALEGDLAREQARPNAERDLHAEEVLARQIAAAAETREVAYATNKAKVATSYNTRVAFEKTIQLLEGELVANNAKLVPANTTLPKNVADFAAYVAEQRAALAKLDEEVKGVRSAPLPMADVVARALHELDQAANRGRLRVTGAGALVLPQALTDARPYIGTEPVKVDDAFALLAALHRDELAAQVEASIREQYRDVPAKAQLSPVQKQERLKEIDAQYFAVELLEVAGVFAAWSVGNNDVGLRSDTSPLAVLDVRSWTARPRREEPLQFYDVPPIQPRPQEKVWIGQDAEIAKARG